jgi:hypothetical protein
MKQERWAKDGELKGFVEEAEALLREPAKDGGKVPPPQGEGK